MAFEIREDDDLPTGVTLDMAASLAAGQDQPDDDDMGKCDHCDTTYDVGSQRDHCAECGSCWSHCRIPRHPADVWVRT